MPLVRSVGAVVVEVQLGGHVEREVNHPVELRPGDRNVGQPDHSLRHGLAGREIGGGGERGGRGVDGGLAGEAGVGRHVALAPEGGAEAVDHDAVVQDVVLRAVEVELQFAATALRGALDDLVRVQVGAGTGGDAVPGEPLQDQRERIEVEHAGVRALVREAPSERLAVVRVPRELRVVELILALLQREVVVPENLPGSGGRRDAVGRFLRDDEACVRPNCGDRHTVLLLCGAGAPCGSGYTVTGVVWYVQT